MISILSNTNNLNTVEWFQVFLSNTDNYMVSSNYFYLVIVIICIVCLHFSSFCCLSSVADFSNTEARAPLNKSWRQHPTKHQLYGHLPPITRTIQVRRTRHAGHCWRSRDELISDVLLWTPTYGLAKAGRHTYSSYVRIRDVALNTCQRRWTIGRSGKRGSRISVRAARHDDDE